MKKILFFACALFVAATADAQKVITDDVNRTTTTQTSTAHGHDEEVNHMNSGTGVDYMAIEEGFGIGLNFAFDYLLIDLSFGSADNDYIDVSTWSAGLGGQYRYWFNKWLYIEGRAGVQYLHATAKIKGGDEEEKNVEFGLFLTPRLGVKLFNIGGDYLSLVGGYRWDFNEFKFKKDYTRDYFTIGLSWVM